MNIFKKWFCSHKWKSHSKQERQLLVDNVVIRDYILEILICENCGKIKKIKY